MSLQITLLGKERILTSGVLLWLQMVCLKSCSSVHIHILYRRSPVCMILPVLPIFLLSKPSYFPERYVTHMIFSIIYKYIMHGFIKV